MKRQRKRSFQFTRPRGARPIESVNGEVGKCFNSRAHGGRDGDRAGTCSRRGGFQFTRPRGARQPWRPLSSGRSRFNSRAHGGRDSTCIMYRARRRVSIHAPTGGATHATHCTRRKGRFNSRAHGGRDLANPWHKLAPREFQFTRPRGARQPNDNCTIRMGHCFNSRAHGGRDRSPATRGSAATRFNSRAHGGRDCSSFLLGAPRLVSIHAPTGGATTCEHTARGPHAGSFNSRAHGGRDPLVTYPYDGSTVSIHAPTGGATPSRCRRPTRRRFQFTRPRGARLSPWRKTRRGAGFNSRAHGGRDTFALPKTHASPVSIHAPTGGAT